MGFTSYSSVKVSDVSDGASLYTWIMYADTPTSGISNDPTNKKYIGIAYNKSVQTPSSVYSDYNWTLMEGTGISSMRQLFYKSSSKYENNIPKPFNGNLNGWQTTQPAWEAGKYLWHCTEVEYKNPTSTVYLNIYCDTSWEAVNNLKVGGRNLFKHSSLVGEELGCDDINVCNSVTPLGYEDEGYHFVTPNAGNMNNGIQFTFNDFTSLGLKRGDTITFSADVKGTSDTNKPFLKIWMPGTNPDEWWVGSESTEAYFTPTNEFQRISVTWTIPASEDIPLVGRICFGIHGNIQSDLYIQNLKLERGTMATDWTPAPEDFSEEIKNSVSGVSSKVDQINKTIENDVWKKDILKIVDKDGNELSSTIDVIDVYNKASVDGFKQTVSNVSTYVGYEDGKEYTHTLSERVSTMEQTAEMIKWAVTQDGTGSSFSITPNAITSITEQFVVKDPTGSITLISGGKIFANSITTDMLATDAIKSKNYSEKSSEDIFSIAGTFIDLSNGVIKTKNFAVNSTGNAYFNGEISSVSGTIGGWKIKDT